MMELIDKQALMDKIGITVECKDCKRRGTFYCNESSAFEYACGVITEASNIDIVLCQECKNYDAHGHRCKVWNHGVTKYDFCSKAERGEE